MRAWEHRPDTEVVDEPFYAYYLARTGLAHPGREAVLAAQPTDAGAVIAALEARRPAAGRLVYEKHMSHHLDDSVSLDWLDEVENAFLIRAPRRMLASLLRVLPDARLEDTGLPQQLRLYEHVRARGAEPPVIDSADVLRNPARVLAALCERLGVPYTDAMLSWPAGPRASDGVWAPHWYAAVERSTGFAPYTESPARIAQDKLSVLAECERLYAHLYAHRLGGAD